MDEEYNIYDFDYYYNRSSVLMLLEVFSGLISFLGLIGNVFILIVKLKQISERNAFEYFILNLSVAFVFMAISKIVITLEECYHKMPTVEFCHSKEFLEELPSACILCSLIGLILVARFYSNVTKKQAAAALVFIWVAAIANAYPNFLIVTVEKPLRGNKTRNICVHDVTESNETYFRWLLHITIKQIVEFAIPAVLFTLLSLFSVVWSSPNKNRSILLYAIIIGSYWCIVSTIARAYTIVFLYFILDLNLDLRVLLLINTLANCIIILNPILYCYFDRVFYKELCQFLKLTHDDTDCEMIGEEDEER